MLVPNIYSDPRRLYVAYLLCAIAAGGVAYLAQRKPDLVISMDGIQASAWGGVTASITCASRSFEPANFISVADRSSA